MSKNDEIAEAFVRSCEAETGKQISADKVETLSGLLANSSDCALPPSRDMRPKRGSWAPGLYGGKCSKCGAEFCGSKTALTCAPCAYAEPEAATEKRTFTFDAKIFVTVDVDAETEQQARERLADLFSFHDANLGSFDGNPVVAQVNFDGADLVEIDGEAV